MNVNFKVLLIIVCLVCLTTTVKPGLSRFPKKRNFSEGEVYLSGHRKLQDNKTTLARPALEAADPVLEPSVADAGLVAAAVLSPEDESVLAFVLPAAAVVLAAAGRVSGLGAAATVVLAPGAAVGLLLLNVVLGLAPVAAPAGGDGQYSAEGGLTVRVTEGDSLA